MMSGLKEATVGQSYFAQFLLASVQTPLLATILVSSMSCDIVLAFSFQFG